jgi:hypothetical protein
MHSSSILGCAFPSILQPFKVYVLLKKYKFVENNIYNDYTWIVYTLNGAFWL